LVALAVGEKSAGNKKKTNINDIPFYLFLSVLFFISFCFS